METHENHVSLTLSLIRETKAGKALRQLLTFQNQQEISIQGKLNKDHIQ